MSGVHPRPGDFGDGVDASDNISSYPVSVEDYGVKGHQETRLVQFLQFNGFPLALGLLLEGAGWFGGFVLEVIPFNHALAFPGADGLPKMHGIQGSDFHFAVFRVELL